MDTVSLTLSQQAHRHYIANVPVLNSTAYWI